MSSDPRAAAQTHAPATSRTPTHARALLASARPKDARTWYDLGRYFDEHEYLEVHNEDGRRANHSDSDGGAPNLWGIFDFSQDEARHLWVDRIASVVSTADPNGANLFDGVFIDGYRSSSSWAPGLIPGAAPAEQAAWLDGAKQLGPMLAEQLGNATIRFINPGQVFAEFPGYSANSIEFFGPNDGDIQFLQSIVGFFPTIEVHAYIGADIALFNLTFAAYLIAVGAGAYFGAGAEWADCDDWLLPHFEYAEPLGAPDGPGALSGGVWTRTFDGGKTSVFLDTGSGDERKPCAPETEGAWSIGGTQQFFALVSSNSSLRVYNLSCSTACSSSWHTATATSPAPFTGFHIVFHMQPGFKPVEDDGRFDESCTVIEYGGSAPWCAEAANPQCKPVPVQRSCIKWASGAVTGNSC